MFRFKNAWKMGIFKRKIELTQYNCNDSNKIAPFKCIIPLRVIIPMKKIPKHFKGFFLGNPP